MNVEPAGVSLDIVFVFPKSAALSLDDGDVEFSMKAAKSHLKKKFHLRDMMYQGKLAL